MKLFLQKEGKAIDRKDYYRIPADTRDLNYNKFVDDGEKAITEALNITPIHINSTVTN